MSWHQLLGHDVQQIAMRKVVQRGKLAHAYLLTGPSGIGKKRFALGLTQWLLCESRAAESASNSCGQCSACLLVEARTHPDLEVLHLPAEKQEFPLETMQEFVKRVGLKPVRGRQRIAIIDDADSFNDESGNCLLKTLEEPPPHSLFLLLSPDAASLLPTIVSRCQHVRFSPMPCSVISTWLEQQSAEIEEEDRKLVAHFAGGSFQRAQLLAEESSLGYLKDLLEAMANSTFSSFAWIEKTNKYIEEAGSESAQKRQRAQLIIEMNLRILRDALVRSGEGGRSFQHCSCEVLSRRFGQGDLLQLQEQCLSAEWMVQRRVQLVLVMEDLIDRIAQKLTSAKAA